ncbi:MAG: hypothetical protein AAFU79_00985 [Myxococcota bacterium]
MQSKARSLRTMLAFLQYAILCGMPVQDFARPFNRAQADAHVQSLLDAVPSMEGRCASTGRRNG